MEATLDNEIWPAGYSNQTCINSNWHKKDTVFAIKINVQSQTFNALKLKDQCKQTDTPWAAK